MIGIQDRDTLDRIEKLATGALHDPSAAASAIRELYELVGPLKERLTRLRATSRIYKVPFVGSVVVASTGITSIGDTYLKWTKRGRVIGVKGLVYEGINLATHVAVSIRDQNDFSFFTDGNAAASISLAALVGNTWDQGGWFPFLDVEVKPSEFWKIAATSFDSLPGSGSTSYTPEVSFLVDES